MPGDGADAAMRTAGGPPVRVESPSRVPTGHESSLCSPSSHDACERNTVLRNEGGSDVGTAPEGDAAAACAHPAKSARVKSSCSEVTESCNDGHRDTEKAASAVVTARSAGLECIVCVRPATENLSCPRCSAIFCTVCIHSWWRAHPSKHGANCPTCRLDTDPAAFQHCPAKQARADSLQTRCECGATYRWGDRSTHACALETTCPFNGCDYSGQPDDIEMHTPRCEFGLRYSMSLVVQTALQDATQAKPGGGVELTPEAHAAILAHAESSRVAAAEAPPGPNGSIRHYVQHSDNLLGLAVKFETTVQEIKRLNRLTSGNLYAQQWIWVPRPPNYTPDRLDMPSLEAMIALRKRELVQTVVKKTKAILEEAVTYLQLAEWNADAAVDMARHDAAWEGTRFDRRPKTLADFRREQTLRVRRGMVCGTCTAELADDRVHCVSCGLITCMPCHRYHKVNARLVPKSLLGVTAPGARDVMVRVCDECASMHGACDGETTGDA
eukprot:m.47613 g.47613  ORF g.47613 m.47613 type:complete len:498 (+) comp6910_c0_seq1:117-1610(+)